MAQAKKANTKKTVEAVVENYRFGEVVKFAKTQYKFKGKYYSEDKLVFPKELLIDYIGQEWYDFYFDEDGKLRNLDDVLISARELSKSWTLVIICVYLLFNDKAFNAVWTRKYSNGTGSFYSFVNKVMNHFEDKYQFSIEIIWKEYKGLTKEKKLESWKKVKHIFRLKGNARENKALLSYGNTKEGKPAIFFDCNYDTTRNQMIFFRSSDDPDGNRGLSPNIGQVEVIFHEEFAQEEDPGTITPQQQMARYKSIHGSIERFIKQAKVEGKLKKNFKVKEKYAANGWDKNHQLSKDLVRVPGLGEKEWREWVTSNPNKNFIKSVIHKGKRWTRATSLANLRLYPKGSEERLEKIEKMSAVLDSNDAYDMAVSWGFMFPGYLSLDNPILSAIMSLGELPEHRKMTSTQFRRKFRQKHLVFGTDWGNSDATVDIPFNIAQDKDTEKLVVGVGGDFFYVKNKGKPKKEQMRNKAIKDELVKHWAAHKQAFGWQKEKTADIAFDIKARSVVEDIEDDYLYNDECPMNGDIIPVPREDKTGFGLEQRPIDFMNFVENESIIFLDGIEEWLIGMLNTLKPKDETAKQPHPRKGEMDVYDAFCMGMFATNTEIE